MTFTLIRILFALISAILGFQFGSQFEGFASIFPFLGAAFGLAVAFFVIFLERGLGKVSLRLWLQDFLPMPLSWFLNSIAGSRLP
jgi:hypothetical protein